MGKIKAVIFDAGGVLHASNSAVEESLAEKLGLDEEALTHIWATYIPLLGTGKITEDEFWRRVSGEYGVRRVDADENLLGRPFAENLVPFVEVRAVAHDLTAQGILAAVLSNTIEPHARVLREQGLYDGFNPVMLSHEIGLRKPDRAAYEYALGTLQTAPDQTVFIDDDPLNTEAAISVGMHAITSTTPDTLRESLREFIPEL